MFIIKIADIRIAIENKYEFVRTICSDYIVDGEQFDFLVSASEDEISKERTASGDTFHDGYLESICLYRNIAKQLPFYNAFVIHCASIEVNGDAYCFAAKSGTGKTTHIKLWRKTFGEKVHVINGDKPIFRLINGKIFVCGTPWCGKEGLNSNVMFPLKSICFLKQAQDNAIVSLSNHDALGKLLQQAFISNDKEIDFMTIDFLGKLIETTPIWMLSCNISQEAAQLSYNAMCSQE